MEEKEIIYQAFDEIDQPSIDIIHDCVHCGFCLGCLACEPAWPSGVRYGRLIESGRSQIERRYDRPFSEKFYRSFLFSIFPYPERLKFLLPFLLLYQATGINRLIRSSRVLHSLFKKL